ncbi:Acid phosphatase, class B-like [Dillenia turbinata]|uniref:Acid phosphatase, class B-like n=1 Tax=Dillenia turbinata TaxID=194707 RepID=A0AAN8VSB5_9MAGN
MSAYGHQMEREYSTQSLSSRGDSELGSRYSVQSRFYMTSFAATVFVGALITVGVLLTSILVALVVMLQSCESKNSGVIETSGNHDYCKVLALHAELNRLKPDDIPSICKVHAIKYIKEGQYMKDLISTISVAESYFSSITPGYDGLDVVLFDIDYLFPPNFLNINLLPYSIELFWSRADQYGCDNCVEMARQMKHRLVLNLYAKLQARGWKLFLLTRKSNKQHNATVEHLISAGYEGWVTLIMRCGEQMQMDSSEYISRRRTLMQQEGFRITGIISSQMDALTGPCLGRQVFKLPNPMAYITEQTFENQSLSF